MQLIESQLAATSIDTGNLVLHGDLHVPAQAQGLVLFAHGSGSSRGSPRNRRVAEFFHRAGLATLRVDLITPEDEADAGNYRRIRYDVARLAERLRETTRWARQQPETAELIIGYYGAGTGGAVALVAAAAEDAHIGAIVARGSPTDLAAHAVPNIMSPTLLIVGGDDETLTAVNLETWAQLKCEKSIEIIPGAGRLFEERGALDNVSSLAVRWFDLHLRKDAPL